MHQDNNRPSSTSQALSTAYSLRNKSNHPLTANDFKGLIAPVLTCFNDDEFASLNLKEIDKYGAWLKRENINGVCINSLIGEGPALGYMERRLNIEAWWTTTTKYNLLTIVQIGGAPLPDVLQSAEHAEELGVHAVLCLPDLYYKPGNIEELVGYCKIVAKRCQTRPFFYYHIPEMTGLYFDMALFCAQAERSITNFMGIVYAAADLESGAKCLREGRVVLLGNSFLMAGALLLGYESFICAFLTVRPDIGHAIILAIRTNNLTGAREKQKQLSDIYRYHLEKCENSRWFVAIKFWFNMEILYGRGPHFSAGPSRKFFLQKSL